MEQPIAEVCSIGSFDVIRFSNKCLLNITIKETCPVSEYFQEENIMSRTGIITNNGIQITKTTEREIPRIIILEKAEMLTTLYEQLAQKFLDILIIKKLKEKQMRLCELCRSLKKETFISIDPKKLHKRVKNMEKEGIIEICNVGGKKFYRLTNKGRKIIEILRKQRYQINEIVQNVIS